MSDIMQSVIEESSQPSTNTFQVKPAFAKHQSASDQATNSKITDHHNPIIAIIQQAEELWHSHEGQPGITIVVNDHYEHYLLKQSEFKDWLYNEYYKRYSTAFSQSVFNDAMSIIKAMCNCDAPQYKTYSRIGESNGKIYIDLANKDWQAIEIDEQGWRVNNFKHVKFIHTKDMQPQCMPVGGGNIEQLKPFLNINDHEQFVLLVGFIVKCFDPKSPYPILTLLGEQGSGKTEISQMLVSLIAPNSVPVRSMPSNEQNLLLAAKYNHIFAVDNLSGITNQQSDWLCRLSTGAGYASRKLFSDNEESTIAVSRPIILNGIDDVIGRPDLLDRAVVLHIPPLTENSRKTKQSLWQDFEAAKPKILGSICDALVAALSNRSSVQLSRRPRMLDFAEFVTAAEAAFGWKNETFLAAYMASIDETNSDSLDSNPLAIIILNYVKRRSAKQHEHSASDWIKALKNEEYFEGSKVVIKEPNKFSSQLMRITPQLRKKGLEVERFKSNGKRVIRITNTSDSQ